MENQQGTLIYQCELPVRWGDMDAYGHVNNAVYIRYLEEARVQMLVKMGANLDGSGIDPVVINVGCTFLKPVVYPATLRIDCFVKDPGRSSFMTTYQLFDTRQPDEPVGEGYAKVVWMDHHTGRSVPLPEAIRAQITPP